nr:hypothetical protein CFP56_04631 [Quercus suber]
MAPVRKRPSIRSRAERSAKDPRGLYAPPLEPVDHTRSEDVEPQAVILTNGKEPLPTFDESWRLNKKDKRTIKHNTLLNKVYDSGIQKSKTTKRRRPGKKLAAANGLSTLADALRDLDDSAGHDEDEWEAIEDDGGDQSMMNVNIGSMRKVSRKRKALAERGEKMIMKSAKSRPGAMKRKHKMELGEMERFRKNLAQITGSTAAGGAITSIAGQSSVADQLSGGSARSTQADRWGALRAFIGGTMQKDNAFSGLS